MTVTEEPRQATSDLPDANALIKEARQRQRRRWTGGAIVVLAMMVSVVSYAIVSKPSARARHTRTSSPSKTAPAQPGPFVTPKAPYALAVAPNGDLLVVDTGRDQILRRLPSGKFRVVGGSGKHGFSGDGGQAVGAELDIQNDSGIAVAKDGTIYFSDTGNGRVREVLPNGIIKTIVGGGTRTLGQGSMPALSASLSPWGLAIGPNGELYIAANAVYRLGPGGILRWVVGKSVPLPKNYCWDCNPAIQNDFLNTDRLALDGAGDLYVAGGGGWGLYEMTAKGASVSFVGKVPLPMARLRPILTARSSMPTTPGCLRVHRTASPRSSMPT